MINFVIVDDNNMHRKKVSSIIMTIMMNNKVSFEIQEFGDFNSTLLNYFKNPKPNSIYILDLELPSGDGIDIARKIRDEYNDWTSPIIILTAHTSLYFQVYKQRLQILDFIGKSDNIEKNINENIAICLRMLNMDRIYKFTYRHTDYTIPINKIDYIQRDDRSIKIVCKNEEYYTIDTINSIKDNFPSYFIISCKGTLLNMNNVLKIDWINCKVYFKDGLEAFVVSKSHKKDIDNYERN